MSLLYGKYLLYSTYTTNDYNWIIADIGTKYLCDFTKPEYQLAIGDLINKWLRYNMTFTENVTHI